VTSANFPDHATFACRGSVPSMSASRARTSAAPGRGSSQISEPGDRTAHSAVAERDQFEQVAVAQAVCPSEAIRLAVMTQAAKFIYILPNSPCDFERNRASTRKSRPQTIPVAAFEFGRRLRHWTRVRHRGLRYSQFRERRRSKVILLSFGCNRALLKSARSTRSYANLAWRQPQ
jgi:hypothetical protein